MSQRIARAVRCAVLALFAVVAVLAVRLPADAGRPPWVATWTASPVIEGDPLSRTGFHDRTIRMHVHASVGGSAIRLHLSNLFGAHALRIERVTVAQPVEVLEPGIVPDSLHRVTFGGGSRVSIPAGASRLSDPVDMPLVAGSDLEVSLYFDAPTGPTTWHALAFDKTFAASGDATRDAGPAFTTISTSLYFLTGVDALNEKSPGAIVAFGDSITDGVRSSYGSHQRWPDLLAARLRQADPDGYGVVDAGIGGNRILLDGDNSYGPRALARFRRDVLQQAGVRAVIVFEGVNDVLEDPHQLDPAKIIAGLRALAQQAHAAHVKIFASPIGPCYTWTKNMQAQERTREAVNTWIRSGRAFDGVFDFDTVLTDPAHRPVMRKAYDSGDHLHPNDTGFAAIARSIDLRVLTR